MAETPSQTVPNPVEANLRPRRRGHALDASRDGAIRDAALDLLTEIGYDRLTMDAVAARAHASKATIYRRWPGKAALVVDALLCSKGALITPKTGSLAGDLNAMCHSTSSKESRFDALVMLGLITALAHDIELRVVFQERIIEPKTKILRKIFEAAVVRGEIDRERNLDLLASIFPALIFQQILITGELPNLDFASQVISEVVLPLATARIHLSD